MNVLKMEATVTFDYDAKKSDELTLRKGDIITNVKVLEGGWWEGTLKDKSGLFPDNFVKLSNEPTSPKEIFVLNNTESGRKWCKVLHGREPLKLEELKLVPGDLIEFLGKEKDGWFKGQHEGKVGIFRSNFVASPIPEEYLYKALYSREAEEYNELTITKGDIITVLSKDVSHEGWWKGQLNRNVGFFPSNFVAPIINEDDGKKEQNREQECPPPSPLKLISFRTDSTEAEINLEQKRKPRCPTPPPLPSKLISDNAEKEINLQNVENGLSENNECVADAHSKELDQVVRNEDTLLTHLTTSRPKPRKRTVFTVKPTRPTDTNTVTTQWYLDEFDNSQEKENNEVECEGEDEKEEDTLVKKVRRKAPWADEVKMYYAEKQQRIENELKDQKGKEFIVDADDEKMKPEEEEQTKSEVPVKEPEEEEKIKSEVPVEDPEEENKTKPPVPDSAPLMNKYVSCDIFNELLEKVRLLEENQLNLHRMVEELIQKTSNTPESISIQDENERTYKSEFEIVLNK